MSRVPALQVYYSFVSNVSGHGLLIFMALHVPAKDTISKKQASTAKDCLFPTG
jgi:hypothetical protein